jgi:hypothetical protein
MHGLSDFIYLPLIGCCCYSSRSSKKRKKAKKQKDQLCNNIVKHKNPVFLGGWVVRTDIERPFSLIVIRFFLLSLLFFVCYTLLRSYHQWQQHVERERGFRQTRFSARSTHFDRRMASPRAVDGCRAKILYFSVVISDPWTDERKKRICRIFSTLVQSSSCTLRDKKNLKYLFWSRKIKKKERTKSCFHFLLLALKTCQFTKSDHFLCLQSFSIKF